MYKSYAKFAKIFDICKRFSKNLMIIRNHH